MNRRSFIRVSTAGGVALLSASTLPSCATPDTASTEPWNGPSPLLDDEDVRLRILSYGLLAPSFRNLQPWWADVKRDGIVVLPERHRIPLPLDPSARQTAISLGCFVETLAVASTAYGYDMRADLFPDGVPDLSAPSSPRAAVCTLVSRDTDVADPLFPYILERRTNRSEFDGKPVSTNHKAQLQTASGKTGVELVITQDPRVVSDISEAIRTEEMRVMSDPDRQESYLSQLRVTPEELQGARDGILLENTGMSGMDRAWFRVLSGVGTVDKRTLIDNMMAALERQTRTTATYGVLLTDGDSQEDRIATGRAFMRLCLAATEHGVALQPFSSAVENEEGRQRIGEITGSSPRHVHMVVRLGYAPAVPHSPRRSLFEVVRI